ncbi:hypothetical protein AX15_006699 [Amanita polypyramis BW_CC]|nr:hypothetical protein AX15_006699 [Amanita polypyramis BW_CC]
MTTAPLHFDIIFAGGGTAACITAGRLAAADPSLKILIIEDGPETRDKPIHVQPARYSGISGNPALGIFLHHEGRPSNALGGRSPIVPTGRCLGGGSSVNAMVYTRAAASDYDDWENVYRNPGWGSKDLIPLLQKAETYCDDSVPYHGYNGPLKISYREDGINVAEQFLDVAAKYDKKRPFTKDLNGFFSCDAYGRWPRYIDLATGKRSDAAHHYIYNQIDVNQNLVIVCGKRVVRIIFEGDRAVGVEYVDGPGGQRTVAKASRLVVVSAGALGSPAILQRSGIGSTQLLRKYDVRQLVDLPGVGEHYMDHDVASVPYIVSNDAETMDAVFGANEETIKPFVEQWSKTGKGPLAHNGIDAGIKMRPGPEELHELGPDFNRVWQEYFVPARDKPVVLLEVLAGSPRIASDATKKFIETFYFTVYPKSLGFVRITSDTDSYAPFDFHPGFLDEPADIGTLRWAYKKGREIIRRMKLYRGEYSPGHPRFPEGSTARCKPAEGPVDVDAPDIAYSKEDNDAIDEFHRERVGTVCHSLGTCAMKPKEDGGVVDPRLNVYGTQCLKVADCSIAPGNVGANTYSTAVAIGEKAAALIAEDLGVSLNVSSEASNWSDAALS